MVCECDICTEIVRRQGQQPLVAGGGGNKLRGFDILVGDGELYAHQLDVKCERELQEPYLIANKSSRSSLETVVLRSPALHHRLRVAFQVGRNNSSSLWRYGVQQRNSATQEQETDFCIEQYPIATERINLAMQQLLGALQTASSLTRGLHVVNFLDTMGQQDLLIAMYYRPTKEEDVETNHQALRELGSAFAAIQGRVRLVAHCRNRPPIVIVVNGDASSSGGDGAWVVETGLFPGKSMQQEEGHFSNPNGSITRQVNQWLHDTLAGTGKRFRLVELCSGCGNHTVGLSGLFSSILSVEIDSKLVEKARVNISANGIANVRALVGDVNHLGRILAREGWTRHEQQADVATVVLVDPPRAGLSSATVKLLCDLRFDYLVYIACGDGLSRNMAELERTYQLDKLCLADHFPFTHFLEKIAWFSLMHVD